MKDGGVASPRTPNGQARSLPCFRMDTPSVAASPSGISPGTATGSPWPGALPPREADGLLPDGCAQEEDEDEYSWRFDLLNALPREKALAFADALRRSEQQRVEASERAAELQQELRGLELRLSMASSEIPEAASVEPSVAAWLREVDPSGGLDHYLVALEEAFGDLRWFIQELRESQCDGPPTPPGDETRRRAVSAWLEQAFGNGQQLCLAQLPCSRYWDDLSVEEQALAGRLGCSTAFEWHGNKGVWSTAWANLTSSQRDAAMMLGFDEGLWFGAYPQIIRSPGKPGRAPKSSVEDKENAGSNVGNVGSPQKRPTSLKHHSAQKACPSPGGQSPSHVLQAWGSTWLRVFHDSRTKSQGNGTKLSKSEQAGPILD